MKSRGKKLEKTRLLVGASHSPQVPLVELAQQRNASA